MYQVETRDAQWYNGFTKRLVQSVKRPLKKILRNAKLNYTELRTVLCEIELMLNERPLTYIYDDDTEEMLTPNHLLFGRNLTDNFITDAAIDVKPAKRLDYLRKLLDHYWTRWQREYLSELREQHRVKSRRGRYNPSIGDIVTIHDPKANRSNWRLGKVTSLINGRDNQIRAAIVDVVSSRNNMREKIRRPINLLYPIEMPIEEH